jgi:hypothetical protein
MSGELKRVYICSTQTQKAMKVGQQYNNGDETYTVKKVSDTGIKVTAERHSDGTEIVFDWEGLRGFVQRYSNRVSLGNLVSE